MNKIEQITLSLNMSTKQTYKFFNNYMKEKGHPYRAKALKSKRPEIMSELDLAQRFMKLGKNQRQQVIDAGEYYKITQ